MMFGTPEIKVEVFKNLYLEDYNKICREAEEIKREAEFEKAAGNKHSRNNARCYDKTSSR